MCLRNSREELLAAFNREYNAKRTSKGTQSTALGKDNKLINNLAAFEIVPLIDLREIEYDRQYVTGRPKSSRRPRRAALPRAFTPAGT